MWVLFAGEAYQSTTVDSAFNGEAEAAEFAGIDIASVDFEALEGGEDATVAVRHIPDLQSPVQAIYRGWMLTPQQYAALYTALAAKNILLINTPEAYKHCHYLPENYSVIAAVTPETVSLPVRPGFTPDHVFPLLERFGSRPLIVKDYVKSQKHYWEEACFIPDASDNRHVRRVVSRFLELQGDSLAEGLVFREFVDLVPLGMHPKSGMPLTREFRRFVLDGSLVANGRYWDDADYGHAGKEPPLDLFNDVLGKVKSRFFTVDIAQRTNGEWLIVELGDAQVSGLPASVDTPAFYSRLRDKTLS